MLSVRHRINRYRAVADLSRTSFRTQLRTMFRRGANRSRRVTRSVSRSISLLSLSRRVPTGRSLLGRSSTTPIVHLVGTVLDRTVGRATSSVRVRACRGAVSVHFHVSNILQAVLRPGGGLTTLLVSQVGIVTHLSVTRGHVPRSKEVDLHVKQHGVSIHMSALPSVCNRHTMLHLLSGGDLRLSLGGLKVATTSGRSLRGLVRLPRNVVLIAKPANSNGDAALCTVLSTLGAPNHGVLAMRSPIRCRLRNVKRARIGAHISVSFTHNLHTVLHRSPSIIVIKRVHSARATRVTIRTSLANRLMLSALRAGDTSNTIAQLHSVNIRSFLLSSSLTKVVTRHLIHHLYPRYQRFAPMSPRRTRVFGCRRLTIAAVNAPMNYPRYRRSNCRKHVTVRRVVIIAPRLQTTVRRGISRRTLRQLIQRRRGTLVGGNLRGIVDNSAS